MLKVINLFSIFFLIFKFQVFFMRVKQFFPLHTFVIETPDRRKEDANYLMNMHWCLHVSWSNRWCKILWIQSLSISSQNNLAYQSECRSLDFVGMTIASHSRFIIFMIHFFCFSRKL